MFHVKHAKNSYKKLPVSLAAIAAVTPQHALAKAME